MKKNLILPAFTLGALLGVGACSDLEVANRNTPDKTRALAAPDDVETLIASSYVQVFAIGHYYNNASFSHVHMANRHTATWGNMGLNDLGREPREPLPNTPSYRWSYVFEANWGDAYRGISGASDGITSIDNGVKIGEGGERNGRAKAFGKGVQGILHCLVGLWYDKGYVIDESIDLSTAELETVDYNGMVAAGIERIDQSIQMSRSEPFDLDPAWVGPNTPWSSSDWADYLTAWKARCRANAPRSDAEANSADWGSIMADASSGNFAVNLCCPRWDDTGPWWDGLKTYAVEENTWHRMHMDWLGMADTSGQYLDWLSFPTEQRTPRLMSFGADQRFPAENIDFAQGVTAWTDVSRSNTTHRFRTTTPFRPERGTYRQSHYADKRHEGRYFNPADWGSSGGEYGIDHMSLDERDLYIAEGRFRTGDYGGAAAIVNMYRTAAGLPPAPANATDAVPGTSGAGGDCIPKKRYDVQGRCGNLRDALIFEHFENVFHIFGGLEFWHGRRFDILPQNTAIHLPIPASDLEVLEQDVYTFGGGGEGSAPNPIPGAAIDPLTLSLQRVAISLERLQERHRELQAIKNSPMVVR